MRAVRRVVVVTLLGLAALIGAAGPASAHSVLIRSDPVDGARVATGPAQVTLTFDEDMPPGFDVVTVVGPDGKAWESGQVTASGPTLRVPVAPLGPAGVYQVGYRVVSGDGHPVQGTVSFTLTAAGTGTPPPQAAPDPPPSGGLAVWPWVVGAVLVLGTAVVAVLRVRR